MPENLIACRPGCYGKHKDQAFAHLARIGVRHVELDVLPREEWAARKEELRKHGLSASSVSGSVDLSKFDSIENFAHFAACAREFGARIVFLSVKSGGRPLDQCYAELRGLGDVADGHGVTVALETHPDLVTNGAVASATMKGVNHPRIKLNFDSANIYYYNTGMDGCAELRKFLPWLGAVHLKETNGGFKTWYFPGLHEGDGIVDFPALFRICNDAGFFGPFTMEIEGIKGEDLSREQACARLEHSMQYLRSIHAVE